MKRVISLLFFSCISACYLFSQQTIKTLPAKRTTATIKLDGNPNEEVWKEATVATQFVEWRPNYGAVEDSATRTEIWLLYDNTSIYVGGYCHEKTRDSVSTELIGRDKIGVNDYVGVIFDTYNDKINGFGFYVTPFGEQYDAKYSNTNGEDDSWNAVWASEASPVADGWTFEMRIPYSALRFVSKDNQTWGLNITRNRKKAGRQFMWNPVDPKVNGFVNQEGQWTGIEKIEAPVRLSFSPYFSTYVNHFPEKDPGKKDWTSSVNGGMDLKYGISDAFTLDMTLIPDFGQVQSDNRVLNLTPFEVRYTENRPFFTEGTELFNKGNLFYSRRVGGEPLHAYDVSTGPNEKIRENPLQSRLINATKVSGRTKKGFGLGVFNAVTKPMYATIENEITKETRKVKTGSLNNYNIVVFDQTLKNNSAISFINTNVTRSGKDYDANVSAALFDFNNKKNTYNTNGKFAISQLIQEGKNINGYSHNINFNKTGGRLNFNIGQELADEKYDINDMGILFNNNYIDHYMWTGYRWLKPTKWYNRIQVNFNAYYSMLYKEIPGQKIDSRYQSFSTNVNANIQMKNLWWAGMYIGYRPEGNDFYDPRWAGWSFRTTSRVQFNPWFETNFTKKYYASFNYYIDLRERFRSRSHEFYLFHRYRFSDKLSVSHDISFNPFKNDAGYYTSYYQLDGSGNYVLDAGGNKILEDIIFSRRNRKTVNNIVSVKFNFNNKSGITFRARHYWSKVEVQELFDLQEDGEIKPTSHNSIAINHQNYNIFNVDAVYTWQFALGSFISVVWKSQSEKDTDPISYGYFKNFGKTVSAPQNNNLSLKVIYFLDYLDFKKWRQKRNVKG
jgi:hypothetical protein